jgi:hypothetical protein
MFSELILWGMLLGNVYGEQQKAAVALELTSIRKAEEMRQREWALDWLINAVHASVAKVVLGGLGYAAEEAQTATAISILFNHSDLQSIWNKHSDLQRTWNPPNGLPSMPGEFYYHSLGRFRYEDLPPFLKAQCTPAGDR